MFGVTWVADWELKTAQRGRVTTSGAPACPVPESLGQPTRIVISLNVSRYIICSEAHIQGRMAASRHQHDGIHSRTGFQAPSVAIYFLGQTEPMAATSKAPSPSPRLSFSPPQRYKLSSPHPLQQEGRRRVRDVCSCVVEDERQRRTATLLTFVSDREPIRHMYALLGIYLTWLMARVPTPLISRASNRCLNRRNVMISIDPRLAKSGVFASSR